MLSSRANLRHRLTICCVQDTYASQQPKRAKSQVFKFKQFTIYQDKCAMKVGTDSMLLGSWANPKQAQYILDIGCGTGVLALMLAQRAPKTATIHAIDVDTAAYQQAADNISQSPWADRISVYQMSFQELLKCLQHGSQQGTSSGNDNNQPDIPAHGYDVLVCNPPYFIDAYLPTGSANTAPQIQESQAEEFAMQQQSSVHLAGGRGVGGFSMDSDCESLEARADSSLGNTHKQAKMLGQQCDDGDSTASSAKVSQRALARHAGAMGTGLTYETLAAGAAALLAPGGRLFVVLAAENREADTFTQLAQHAGLTLVRFMRVHSTPEEPKIEKRRLMEFQKILSTHALSDCQDNTSEMDAFVQPRLCTEECLIINQSVASKAASGMLPSQFAPTPEYIELTKDFHLDTFIKRWICQ